MMVGYVHDSTTIWRLWDFEKKRAIEASNVTFLEEEDAYRPAGQKVPEIVMPGDLADLRITEVQDDSDEEGLAALIQPISIEKTVLSDQLALFKISKDQIGLPLCFINVDAIVVLLAVIPSGGFSYFSEKQSCFLEAGGGL
jgi:hypothetical protein